MKKTNERRKGGMRTGEKCDGDKEGRGKLEDTEVV